VPHMSKTAESHSDRLCGDWQCPEQDEKHKHKKKRGVREKKHRTGGWERRTPRTTGKVTVSKMIRRRGRKRQPEATKGASGQTSDKRPECRGDNRARWKRERVRENKYEARDTATKRREKSNERIKHRGQHFLKLA
jgi:hypothetical protein